jgi:hypothetical protein
MNDEKPTPGSTSSTISIASFQKGTIVFRPVRLKSSSMKSSETSQKYSCPGSEQNQLIHVRVEVGVEEAEPRSMSETARTRTRKWKVCRVEEECGMTKECVKEHRRRN